MEDRLHLEVTGLQRVLTLFCAIVLPALLLLGGIATWWVTPPPPLPIKVLGLALPLLPAYSFASVITRLTILPDGTIECSSLVRTNVVHVTDIKAIDMRRGRRGFVTIRTSRTRAVLYRRMPGALDALHRIAAEHPAIHVRQ